ncbi:unnamed protein product [Closterium sp. Yama58-4]|nr:unnamed protein product [Closterium sp. Yama58-4]
MDAPGGDIEAVVGSFLNLPSVPALTQPTETKAASAEENTSAGDANNDECESSDDGDNDSEDGDDDAGNQMDLMLAMMRLLQKQMPKKKKAGVSKSKSKSKPSESAAPLLNGKGTAMDQEQLLTVLSKALSTMDSPDDEPATSTPKQKRAKLSAASAKPPLARQMPQLARPSADVAAPAQQKGGCGAEGGEDTILHCFMDQLPQIDGHLDAMIAAADAPVDPQDAQPSPTEHVSSSAGGSARGCSAQQNNARDDGAGSGSRLPPPNTPHFSAHERQTAPVARPNVMDRFGGVGEDLSAEQPLGFPVRFGNNRMDDGFADGDGNHTAGNGSHGYNDGSNGCDDGGMGYDDMGGDDMDDWMPRSRGRKDRQVAGGRIKARSMAERQRRERISEGLQKLRMAVRGHGDTATMLDNAVAYVQALQRRVTSLETNMLLHQASCGGLAFPWTSCDDKAAVSNPEAPVAANSNDKPAGKSGGKSGKAKARKAAQRATQKQLLAAIMEALADSEDTDEPSAPDSPTAASPSPAKRAKQAPSDAAASRRLPQLDSLSNSSPASSGNPSSALLDSFLGQLPQVDMHLDAIIAALDGPAADAQPAAGQTGSSSAAMAQMRAAAPVAPTAAVDGSEAEVSRQLRRALGAAILRCEPCPAPAAFAAPAPPAAALPVLSHATPVGRTLAHHGPLQMPIRLPTVPSAAPAPLAIPAPEAAACMNNDNSDDDMAGFGGSPACGGANGAADDVDDWMPRSRGRKDRQVAGGRIKARSMAERQRRERISEGLQKLRMVVRGHGDTATMLDNAVAYVDALQRRVSALETTLLLHKASCKHPGQTDCALASPGESSELL